eukprot:1104855-Prymnesium_polylepis.1
MRGLAGHFPGRAHLEIRGLVTGAHRCACGLADLSGKLLWFVSPGQCIEVDEHVVASAQSDWEHILTDVSNLEEPWPDAVELLGEFSCSLIVRTAVHLDGDMFLGKLEARRTLQVDVTRLRLGQQPPAHDHHHAVLEGCDARPLDCRMLEEHV